MAAKRGLKLRHKQTEAQKRKVRWTSILTTKGIPSMPHHIEDGDNVGSQPGHVTPYSQSGSLCTGGDISRFESVDSNKQGISSDVTLSGLAFVTSPISIIAP